MARVKRGTIANKRRKNLLKYTKGFKWGRKSKFRAAKEAIFHAWEYSYIGRKAKKRNFRQLWETQINAACRKNGLTYSHFIYGLKQNKIELDRKILSEIAQTQPEIFEKIVSEIKK